MRTANDFIDKIYNILISGGIESHITGKVWVGSCPKVDGETIIVNALPTSHIDDDVDSCYVNINLWIPDKNGSTQTNRFRFLIAKIMDIVLKHKSHENDFSQLLETNEGTDAENTVSSFEYFFVFPIFDTTPEADPERKAYSYWSLRTNCYYEH